MSSTAPAKWHGSNLLFVGNPSYHGIVCGLGISQDLADFQEPFIGHSRSPVVVGVLVPGRGLAQPEPGVVDAGEAGEDPEYGDGLPGQ